MKIQSSMLLAAMLAAASGVALAQNTPAGPCQAKREDISRSIEAATAQGQKHRVRGLKKALSEVESNCSDTKLAADHQKRIEHQEQAVAERERDLQQAQADGDAKKVARRQSKLAEEQAKLQQLKSTKY
mgnify:CR=1 FL=1